MEIVNNCLSLLSMKPFATFQAARIILASGTSFILIGCAGTFHDVKPGAALKPPAIRPGTLVVGEVIVEDTRVAPSEAATYVFHFRQGVQHWSTNHQAFKEVITAPSAGVPSDAIVLSGVIRDVEKGSKAARFWVGMGAGQARVQGNFEIKDSAGTSLCTFMANRSYLGGVGAGGWDMLNFEDLFTKLGEVTAETTDKWLKGQKID